jgi:hypothetical protein
MTVALRRPMTLDEFLEWEDRQPLRYEFDGVQATPMTGGALAHVLGPESVLSMPEIGVEVPIAEVYEGIDLPPRPAEDQPPG